jgi:hypothetical protein
MTAAQAETTEVSEELRRIEGWRADELERAGFDSESAALLSVRHDIDLHLAVGLARSGCSPDLALRILL